jgi:hypothetical protein
MIESLARPNAVAVVAAARAAASNVRVFIACLLVVFCITGMMVARPWFPNGTAHRDAIYSSKSQHHYRENYDKDIGKNATGARGALEVWRKRLGSLSPSGDVWRKRLGSLDV